MSKTKEFFIGYTNNLEDRNKASSGGIGTALTKYLLTQTDYGTALTFEFNQKKCQYVPKLVHSVEEINICGSIYQDIDILDFVKNNLIHIKGGIIVSCPPCQVQGIRRFLDKNNIKSFIISFCCSGQITIDGTWKYYEFLGINKEDVLSMQYRGNGWPSGIQILLKDGRYIYHDNYTDPWRIIHSAGFYKHFKNKQYN